MSANFWLEANQQLLAAEFARLKALLAGSATAAAEEQCVIARAELPSPGAIDALAAAFDLSGFEREILLLCAGIEMDASISALCTAHGPSRQPFASFALALAIFPNPHWSALTPVKPLRRWRIVEVRDETALTSSRLSIDERILHFLAGINYLDPRLAVFIHEQRESGLLGETQQSIVDSILATRSKDGSGPTVVHLSGDDPAAQLEVARASAALLGLRLHVMNAADIPQSLHEAAALTALWSREAALLGSALCVTANDGSGSNAASFARGLGGTVFVASRDSIATQRGEPHFRVDRPAAREQQRIWEQALGAQAASLNGTLARVAAQFRFSTDVIIRTAQVFCEDDTSAGRTPAALWKACRNSVRVRLEDLAQRVDPVATWDDLVLPATQLETLHQIAAHARHRMTVYERWGFAARSARGLGISVLFAGESGTGKTMAAEVLANELHLDLYRIDLALMVSKYIGETEKNLRRVFEAAEESGAILLFDEADALFGKRSEIKDSRDRYANIEVSYLLQRMESYRGLAILTTNLKGALDVAFQRRLRFVVPFPFPDQSLRERIWRGVFPTEVPLGALDHSRLAQLNVAGGNIRNIALNAAFLAADTGAPVGMSHLLMSARSEATKRERPYSDAETRGWI